MKKIVVLILLLGLVIRLWGLKTEYWYNQDTARDILVAREAVATGQIPLVGPFSSAGPFIFGPHWYWFLMGSETIGNTPVVIILLSMLTVFLISLTGYLIRGKRLFLICLVLTSFSPLFINNAWTISLHGLSGFFTALYLFLLVYISEKPNRLGAFFMGFSLAMAVCLHYQALNLFILLPFALYFLKLNFVWLVAGFSLVVAPFAWWDWQRNLSNFKEIIYYFLVGQNKFYVPNRWLTYVFEFWSQMLGGFLGLGIWSGFIVALAGFASFILNRRAWFNKKILLIVGFIAIEFLLLRFYKGPKFSGYFIYLFPFLALLISYSVLIISEESKILFGVLVVIFFVSFAKSILDLRALPVANFDLLPKQKYTVYSDNPYATECAYSLALYLDDNNLTGGIPVGICPDKPGNCPGDLIESVAFKGSFCSVYSLQNNLDFINKTREWKEYSREAIYDDVENWWRKN